MITIKPIITAIKEYQRDELLENAIKLNTPRSIDEMTKKAVPIATVFCALLFITMMIKPNSNHTRAGSFPAIVAGFLPSFVLAKQSYAHTFCFFVVRQMTFFLFRIIKLRGFR